MDRPNVEGLSPPNRTLTGPGPSEDETRELLRYAFRTDDRWTLPVSDTGSAAMEAAIGNTIELGDTCSCRRTATSAGAWRAWPNAPVAND